MSPPPIAVVLVVVPVHDEEALLDRCLTALEVAVAAAAERGIRSLVRVVLDDCRDGSMSVASRHPFPIVRIDARAVGAARAAGVDHGLNELAGPGGVCGAGGLCEQRIWIASTDADSAVPPQWIVAQVDAADAGADVFLGTVRPDFDDLSLAHRAHWLDTHPSGEPTGNTHGANLGVRAGTYRAAGGFEAVPEHEDALLVERCRRVGAVVHASGAVEVLTSGRVEGRTPGGYAGFVRHEAQLYGSV